MHYIQSSLFTQYGLYFLILCMLCVSVVAYVHNNDKLLKRSLFSSFFLFVVSLVVSTLVHHSGADIYLNKGLLATLQEGEKKITSPDIFYRILEFLTEQIVKRL